MRKVIVAIACLLGVAVYSTKVIAITIQPATTTSHSSIVYVSDGGDCSWNAITVCSGTGKRRPLIAQAAGVAEPRTNAAPAFWPAR